MTAITTMEDTSGSIINLIAGTIVIWFVEKTELHGEVFISFSRADGQKSEFHFEFHFQVATGCFGLCEYLLKLKHANARLSRLTRNVSA